MEGCPYFDLHMDAHILLCAGCVVVRDWERAIYHLLFTTKILLLHAWRFNWPFIPLRRFLRRKKRVRIMHIYEERDRSYCTYINIHVGVDILLFWQALLISYVWFSRAFLWFYHHKIWWRALIWIWIHYIWSTQSRRRFQTWRRS